MWLMTKYGVYSIVQKEPGVYHVRARERRDLENLISNAPLPDAQIVETHRSDYAFRILVGRDELQAILSLLGNALDYDNFKGKIDETADQAHKPYHEVWAVLAKALGAYGRPGTAARREES
jgi:hypothetical protein